MRRPDLFAVLNLALTCYALLLITRKPVQPKRRARIYQMPLIAELETWQNP